MPPGRGLVAHSFNVVADLPLGSGSMEVRVGPQGRVVIPASLRRAAGIRPGDSLTARLEHGRLVLERRETIISRLRERFASVPPTVSLSDELLHERREEARHESDLPRSR